MRNGYLPSALAGLALWLTTVGLSGAREPWDAPSFWSTGYPLAVVLAIGLALLWPVRSWLWGPIVMAMMIPVMALNGSDLSLLPLGLVAIAVLSVPPMLAGFVAGRARRRRTDA